MDLKTLLSEPFPQPVLAELLEDPANYPSISTELRQHRMFCSTADPIWLCYQTIAFGSDKLKDAVGQNPLCIPGTSKPANIPEQTAFELLSNLLADPRTERYAANFWHERSFQAWHTAERTTKLKRYYLETNIFGQIATEFRFGGLPQLPPQHWPWTTGEDCEPLVAKALQTIIHKRDLEQIALLASLCPAGTKTLSKAQLKRFPQIENIRDLLLNKTNPTTTINGLLQWPRVDTNNRYRWPFDKIGITLEEALKLSTKLQPPWAPTKVPVRIRTQPPFLATPNRLVSCARKTTAAIKLGENIAIIFQNTTPSEKAALSTLLHQSGHLCLQLSSANPDAMDQHLLKNPPTTAVALDYVFPSLLSDHHHFNISLQSHLFKILHALQPHELPPQHIRSVKALVKTAEICHVKEVATLKRFMDLGYKFIPNYQPDPETVVALL